MNFDYKIEFFASEYGEMSNLAEHFWHCTSLYSKTDTYVHSKISPFIKVYAIRFYIVILTKYGPLLTKFGYIVFFKEINTTIKIFRTIINTKSPLMDRLSRFSIRFLCQNYINHCEL